MTGKQNMVFWIGLIIILVNFWVAGQSTTLWQSLTNKGTSPSASKPGSGGKVRIGPAPGRPGGPPGPNQGAR